MSRNDDKVLRRRQSATELTRRSSLPQLETDVVSLNYHKLGHLRVFSSSMESAQLTRPADVTSFQAAVGVFLLYAALAITSCPLFVGVINSETVVDNVGSIVTENASYAPAYFMGGGFFEAYVNAMSSNETASSWYPQLENNPTSFLNFPFLDQAAYPNGACSILDETGPECILMTGDHRSVRAYGVCRNGSEFVSVQYVQVLVTPADVGALVASGNWAVNAYESVVVGLKQPPVCVNGNKLQVLPDINNILGLSGAFAPTRVGRLNYLWFDVMNLPTAIHQRMFYLDGKTSNGLGITIPSRQRHRFSTVVLSDVFGASLVDKLEIVAPFEGSKSVYVLVYRTTASTVYLPRLQFTYAVAAQTLLVLVGLLAVTVFNKVLNTYHLLQQLLRLPTFFVLSIQLLYVVYCQVFDIVYLGGNDNIMKSAIYYNKLLYVAGASYLLLHQLDVRAAVTLWPKMANTDVYYVLRVFWMVISVVVFMASLAMKDPMLSPCASDASECPDANTLLIQHYVGVAICMVYLIAFSVIQMIQYRCYPLEYASPDTRAPNELTSFEGLTCGNPLSSCYDYNTLVPITKQDGTIQQLTCSKAVRDEGFVFLGGCDVLIRSKDLHVIMGMKLLTKPMARILNLSIILAHTVDNQLMPLRRVSKIPLYLVAKRWNGQVSYPDIG